MPGHASRSATRGEPLPGCGAGRARSSGVVTLDLPRAPLAIVVQVMRQ